MSFERQQKGNPNKITINQHTFPRASIARFAVDRGTVQVFHMKSKKVFPAKPTEKIFCAMRVWDHKAESGYMKHIEDSFQTLAEGIISGRVHRFDLVEMMIINTFYCLWNIRFHFKKLPLVDEIIAGKNVLGVKREFTKDEQEHLELNGVFTIRPDLTVPSRFLTSPRITLNLTMALESMGDAQWGILRANEGEFVVPDNFNQARIVPISPTVSLWSQTKFSVECLDRQSVAEINRCAIRTSVDYYFARELSQCPLF